jgi:transposase InsO family protein
MDAEIVSLAGACEECTSRLPSHPPEPLRPHEPASRPFEKIHADLCQLNGRHFLIQVDAFSGWPHVVYFPVAHISAKKVINAARELFINVGVPVKYWSDGGPQFPSAVFKQFLKEWGVTLGLSSPHFPQSNGVAEAGVKFMKKAGSFTSGSFDVNKFGQSLLLFRNTAISGGRSPTQIVFNRPMRNCLPAYRRLFAVEWQKDADVLEKRARRAKELRTEHFNRRAHPLPPLQVGNAVLIQHPISKCWSTPGVITEVGLNRDYLVKTAAGRVFRRNRRFL